jgi:hypothetical protein
MSIPPHLQSHAPSGDALLRIVISWAIVMAVAIAALRAFDSLPAWVTGDSRLVHRYATIAEAEHELGRPVLLPSYFPDGLRWPPSVVRVYGRFPASVVVEFSRRNGRGLALVICEAVPPIPVELLAEGRVLHQTGMSLGRHSAIVSRRLLPDGALVHDLGWSSGSRLMLVRSYDGLELLMSVGASLERKTT